MEKNKKLQKEKTGNPGYINKNCWLAKTLNYAPYKRCQFCELEFRRCLFLQYQIISLILISFFLTLSFLIEDKSSKLLIISIFSLVIVYGYFFNKNTDKLIRAFFDQMKAKEALKELAGTLQQKVDEQTKGLLQTNKELKEKNRLNQELLNIKTDFLRVVNHQLNTPLAIMRNAYAMIKDGTFNAEKGFEYAAPGLERMSQTIYDFWDAFQLEGEKMEIKPEPVDLASMVAKLIEEKKKLPLAIQRKLTLTVSQPTFKVPLVWCDPKKIIHAASNLLDNAVFYTEKGGVAVSYELIKNQSKKLVGDFLKVNVKDTGVGIAKEDKERLFKKFSRGSGATGLHPDGSGLGLYIAKKIIEGNEGELTYTSAGKGQGSTFSFILPLYAGQKPPPPSQRDLIEEKAKVIMMMGNKK